MKVLKKIGKVLACIVLIVAILLLIGLNCKTVLAARKNADVIAAAKPFEELMIPEGVQIVGLGEASHGCIEFQESKLDVLKMLVEKYDYRAIAIEADFNDCLAINAYIQGGEGDARSLVNDLSFVIYHTQQMADLVEWMRTYNATASEDKKLRFYGFDMQNPEKGVPFLLSYLEEHAISDCETTNLQLLADEERSESLSEADVSNIRSELDAIRKALEAAEQDLATVYAGKAVENIHTALDYYMLDYTEMNDFRDTAMAANVSWLLELEKKIGTGKLMLAGHNGHTGIKGETAFTKVTMGGVLKEQYGDAYYSLGTDFFKGDANIRVDGTQDYQRKDFYVTTADPMAYQAKYQEGQRYVLDFTSLDETGDKAVYDMVHGNLTMGTLGEGFATYYYLVHPSYRFSMAPVDLYDGMLFYYEVHAIQPEF
ncbi:MAG: erythromycin esterase family protein [Lachnospiraceae bacterium]|nr:erythromycin esterase family protein [Lachnospiraceae bacterium]